MVHGKTPNCGRWDFFAAVDIGVFRLRSALRVRACRKAASLQKAALRHFAGVQSSPDLTKNQRKEPSARDGSFLWCGRWDFFRHFRHVCLFSEPRRRSYAANHPLSKAAQWLCIRLPRSRTRSSPDLTKNQRKEPSARDGSFLWCGRWDLNPYACAHAPQTCLSANSSTAAQGVLYDAVFELSTIILLSFAVFLNVRVRNS